jgi:rhodanese-related sulfurtransferase
MAKHAPRFLALVHEALRHVREVPAQQVHERLQRGETFYLVDVREESEWNAGRLPQAMHLARGVLERDIEARIPDTQAEIVLYCGGGYRSALAAESLQKMGYTNVWSMAGGFRGWREAGLPVVK